MSYQYLSTPFRIGELSIPNRIVMPPLVIWASDESGCVNETHLEHYKKRTGPGLVIIEATTVSPEGRLHGSQLGLFNDSQTDGIRRLVDLIRENGSVPGIQLHHAGGKSTREYNYGAVPLVPSVDAYPAGKLCREITRDDIAGIIDDFCIAAERAVEAGCEYIELHGAHGYLGCQFLSPRTNVRNDEYGGSLSGRQRFLLELYNAVDSVVGNSALVTVRLGVAENDGLTLEEGIDTCLRLKEAGAPVLHISNAHDVPGNPPLPESNYSTIMQLGIAVKQSVDMPIIGVGGVVDPDDAEALVSSGDIDLVAVGKGSLADSQWARKVLDGVPGQIHSCIGCRPCRWFKAPERCPVQIAHPS